MDHRHDFRELGHYAVGTANLIPSTILDRKFNSNVWGVSDQKPMLYFAVGGQVEDHDMGSGHRRTDAELKRMDYSNYVSR